MAKRKMSYTDLTAENVSLNQRLGQAERMVRILASGESAQYTVDIKPLDQHDPSRYQWKLFEATKAHGGIVLMRYRYPGQREDYSVARLDDLIIRWQTVVLSSDVPFVEAMGRLRSARQTLIDLEQLNKQLEG